MQEVNRPENARHYPGLDGLRGLAVLMVMVQHYVQLTSGESWGWTGVRIFFALSGFLITGILYDTRDVEHRWSVFYARRSLRIFPLYYGILLAGVLLYPVFHWTLHASYWLWPVYLQNLSRFIWPGMTPGGPIDQLYGQHFQMGFPRLRYGHFWSLAVEEQFYLVWPFVVFAVRRRETLMKICVAVILLTPLVRLGCYFGLSHRMMELGFQERFTLVQFDALLIGALFALWIRGPHPNMTRLANYILAFTACAILAGEAYCHLVLKRWLVPSIDHPIFGSVGMSCVNFASVAVVLLAIDHRTWFSRALGLRPLRYIGTISYGFYVFHDLLHDVYEWPIIHYHLPNPRGLFSLLIGLVGTLIIASASFYGFERPFLRLKSRFSVPRRELAIPAKGHPETA